MGVADDRPDSGKLATTYGLGLQDPRFAALAHRIGVPPRLDRLHHGQFYPLDELRLFVRVLRAALRYPALLLYSSRGRLKPELLAVAGLGLWPRRWRPSVILYGEMYEPNSGLRGAAERVLIRLADRAVDRYIVSAAAEREVFARTWGIEPAKVRVSPVFLNHSRRFQLSGRPPGDHVFAGGNSFRDFGPLIEAARRMPTRPFVLCTQRLRGRSDIPPNVRVTWADFEGWIRLVESAAVVVVPIRQGLRRGAGFLTCFEAMWARKVVVVPEALGVREYIRHGETGLIVDGTPEAYTAALRWALDPANQAETARIGQQAHDAVGQHFTLENHITQLLAAIQEVLAARGQRGPHEPTGGQAPVPPAGQGSG